MEDRLETIIRDWLNTTFNNPEAMPNPMIKSLAEEINKHRWEIYQFTKEEYEIEDIETIAEGEDIELTENEKGLILHRYHNSEYQDMETLRYLVEEVVDERGKEILIS